MDVSLVMFPTDHGALGSDTHLSNGYIDSPASEKVVGELGMVVHACNHNLRWELQCETLSPKDRVGLEVWLNG